MTVKIKAHYLGTYCNYNYEHRSRSTSPESVQKKLRRRAVMKSGETNVVKSHVPMKSKKYLQVNNQTLTFHFMLSGP